MGSRSVTSSLLTLVTLFLCLACTQALYKYGNNVQTVVYSYSESYRDCWSQFFGLFCTTRYRTRYSEYYQCHSGWYSNDNWACDYAYCNGLTNLNGACNNYFGSTTILYDRSSWQYYSDGSCTSPGSCSCTKSGFYSQGHTCGMCDAKSNCDIEVCTSTSDESCSRCSGRVHDQKGYRAYRNSNGNCHQACSWRSDSTRCYPGTCSSEYSSSCSCTSGFSGSHCQNIDNNPTIHNNKLEMIKSSGDTITSPANVNSGSSQGTVWTNYNNPSTLYYRFQSSYTVSAPSYHNYVTGFRVGITGARFYLYQTRSSSTINSHTHVCPGGMDANNAYQSVLTCDATLSASSQLTLPMNHLDIVTFTVQADNTGYVTIVNHETGNSETHYYSGRTQSNSFTFTIDIVNPYHCYSGSTCLNQMLDVPDVALSSPVSTSWDYWYDDDSGIASYYMEVYKLVASSSQLVKSSTLTTSSFGSGSRSHSFSVTDSGMYSIVFTCTDVATNYKKARRLFLYDPTSSITIHSGIIRVQTAASNTSYVWQHSLTPVTVDWANRYWNSFHYNNELLNYVVDESEVESNYDDYESTRPRTAITHIWGIVKFTTTYSVDHQGGATLSLPGTGSFVQESDLDMTRTFDPGVVDGDTVRFWVRSYDIRDYDYSYVESITVHIDTSDPVIENLWLTSPGTNDYTQLYVHNDVDLQAMTIEWDAYDYHSGIDTIYWRLYDNFTGSDLDHGYNQESAQGSTSTLSQCNSAYSGYARGAQCYCTGPVGCYHKHYVINPSIVARSSGIGGIFDDANIGVHDYDYWIEVTVTNHANLITVLTIQVTVDNSPPEGGHVYDSTTGTDDEDYRSDLYLNAHWEGFYDKESGIRFYQYAFHTSCLSASDFDKHNPDVKVYTTTNTYASYTAPSWSTYYVSVVAFNEALGESDPVCSDGITLDSNTPSISNIWIQDASIEPGLITYGSTVYLVEQDRMRVTVTGASTSCRNSARSVSYSQLIHFPPRSHDGGTTDLTIDSAIACNYNALDSDFLSQFYLINDGHIYMNWTSSDSISPLYDQYVAIGTSSSSSYLNILGWTQTDNHNTFQLYHPSINEGQTFYIHVKVVDVVNRYYIKTIGPAVLHRTTAPSYSSTLYFSVTYSVYFCSSWTTSYFSDYEKYHLKYKMAIEDIASGEIIHPYSDPLSGATCSISSSSSPTCSCVPFSSLLTDVHEGHQYRSLLQVTNLANLTYTKQSQTVTYYTEYPEEGVIYEVIPDSEQETIGISNSEDTNYQLSRNSLKVRWLGFETRWHDVTYELGLGTSPTSMNIAGYRYWNSGVYEYTFTGLNLYVDYVYYCRIRARTSLGYIYHESDGVRISQESRNSYISVNDGIDCHHQYNDKPVGFSAQHQTNELSVSCPSDLTYQPMTNMYSATWSMSSTNKQYFPDIRWNMEIYNRTSASWEETRAWEGISRQEVVTATGLSLIPGETYRSGVKFCVGRACSIISNSNGVTITPNPPVSGSIAADYSVSGSTGTLVIEFETFKDPDIVDLTQAQNAIDGYQYALTDNTLDSKLLQDWQNVNTAPINSTFSRITLTFNPAIDFSVCRTFALKGYNYVGMSATIYTEILNCTAYDPLLIVPNVVIDAVGQRAGSLDYVGDSVVLEMNAEWPTPDADYTPYTNILSAVWPKLRHRNYTYAVVRLTGSWTSTHRTGSNHLSLNDPCNHINAIYCGQTTKEYANIYFSSGSLLTYGRRYAVCVHAATTQIIHEKWVEDLPEVGECSDGITVDTQAPTAGRVLVANLRNSMYLPYTNEITVQWDQFSDVETQSYASHDSAISKYQLALGSIEYGEDVLKFYDVGLINQLKLSSLNFVEGSLYYASIRAFDFNSKYTTVTSSGFVVDNSPPIVTNAQFKFNSKYLTSTTTVSVCWDGMFVDPESSISSYRWAVGSRPGHTDRLDFQTESTTCGSATMSSSLMDGKSYYVTVQAYNGANLYNITSSKPMMVAINAPTAGTVFDGPSSGRTTTTQDDDYKTVVNTPLESYWRWFYSPYSTLSYYLVSLGTCDGCDDVAKEINTGLRTEKVWNDIQLTPGVAYYTTVTACDSTDRCATATSDGILIDTTTPVGGVVQDGTADEDIEFQNIRTFIGAKWYGFHDPESGIVKYHWSAGTSPGSTNIKSWTDAGFTQIAYDASFSSNLPVGSYIYINVRAYNRAGLYTDATSNGFIVDNSAPGANFVPRLIEGIGTIDGTNLISRDALRVEWSFTDSQSSIEKYWVSITSHFENSYSDASVELPAVVTQHTYNYQDIYDMQDGSDYYIKVTACNKAQLCTTSTSSSILFDSTPPLPGMFAVGTIHAARLTRHQSSWMTYSSTNVNLAWVGFSDRHSGISTYLVSIGSTPFATDLNSGNTYTSVSHSNSGTTYDDEGYIQLNSISTNNLGGQSTIFIGIWAVNGVGLKSQVLHHEFTLNGGNLELKRRCTNYNCQGHCVCAIQDQTCSAPSGCTDITSGGPTHDIVTVEDVSDLSFSTGSDNYSPSRTYLAAQWSITTTQGLSVERYEVAVGSASSSTPTGIFNSGTERVWYDMGQMTQAAIPLHDRILTSDTAHSVFIRAWYSSNQYAIFKSNGITNAPYAITTTNSIAVKVKDLLASTDTKDTDYIASSSTVYVKWDSLFQAGTSGIDKFKVYISTKPGGHDIHSSSFISSPTTSYTATGLSLLENVHYYSNVLVYNHAGIVSYDSSDGFIVDLTAPDNGIVLDGSELTDIDAQKETSVLPAQWRHFADTGSGIRRYYWCISSLSDTTSCNIMSWADMGLKTDGVDFTSVAPGTTVYHKVKAEDWAGNMSPVSVSNGVTIDTTGPTTVSAIYLSETELLSNPSFETDTYVWDNVTSCDGSSPSSWSISSGGCTKLQMSNSPVAYHLSQYILISGELTQTVAVGVGNLYRLQIKVGYAQAVSFHHKSMEGYINLGLDSHSFHLDPDRCQGQCEIETESSILWYTFTFYHTAETSSLTLTIGTRHFTSDMRLALDDTSLVRVYYSQQYGGQPSENYMSHHVMFFPRWSTLNAVWHFTDSETPIADYSWAIGTVPGGTQLQGFKSVGVYNQGIKSDLSLNHNSSIHVTVIATNLAGVSTKIQYTPILVDMTPPLISNLNDGPGQDVDYQTTYTIRANWNFADNESSIDYCNWAIGTKPGAYDIKIFERLGQGVTSASHSVNSISYPAPYTFYTTVRCFNNLGLFSTAYTNGVTVVSPSRQDGIDNMKLLKDSNTFWAVSDQCVTTPDSLRLKWDLQQTDTLIQYYRFSILDVTPPSPIEMVLNCTVNSTALNNTGLNATSANVTNFNQTSNATSAPCNYTVLVYPNSTNNATEINAPYKDYAPFSAILENPPVNDSMIVNISIIPVDIFGTDREGTEQTVTINPPGPIIGGIMTAQTNLTSGTNMTLDWSNIFTSYWSNLTYEVTVGTKLGASNIVQWQQTQDTSMALDLSRSELNTFNLSVVISAYDSCGFFATYTTGLFPVYLPNS